MANLIELIYASKQNPNLLKSLEHELNVLSNNDDYVVLQMLLDTNNFDCSLFCMIAAERRLKNLAKKDYMSTNNENNKSANDALMKENDLLKNEISKFLQFLEYAIQKAENLKNPIYHNKVSDIIVLFVTFYFPLYFSTFFEFVNQLIQKNEYFGYVIFKKFCESMNLCTDISANRKAELRKISKEFQDFTLQIILSTYDQMFSNVYASETTKKINADLTNLTNSITDRNTINSIMSSQSYISPLNYSALLKMIMQTLTSSITLVKDREPMLKFIFMHGVNNEYETIDFFSELLTIDADQKVITQMIDLALTRDHEYQKEIGNIIVSTALSAQNKSFFENQFVLQFVFTLIETENIEQCIDFFSRMLKTIKGKNNKNLSNGYLTLFKEITYKLMNIYKVIDDVLQFFDAFHSQCESSKTTNGSNLNPPATNKQNIEDFKMIINNNNVIGFFMKEYLKEIDLDDMEKLKNDIENFVSEILADYRAISNQVICDYITVEMQPNNISTIPRSIMHIFLYNNEGKNQIQFNDNYLNCYNLFLQKNENCVNLLHLLNYSNTEDCKLALKIIKKYKTSNEIIGLIINQCKSAISEEVLITCIALLNQANQLNPLSGQALEMIGNLGTEWDYRMLLAFLPKFIEQTKNYIQDYFNYFLKLSSKNINEMYKNKQNIFNKNTDKSFPYSRNQKKPLDFILLSKINRSNNDLPGEIYQKLYNDIDQFALSTIKFFLNEFVNFLNDEIAIHFITKIIKRIEVEHENSDQIDSVACLKSLLNYVQRKICCYKNKFDIESITVSGSLNNQEQTENNLTNSKLTFYTTNLIDLLNIKDSTLVQNIYSFILKTNIEYDRRIALYKLLLLYNSSEMVDAQITILNFIVLIIDQSKTKNDLAFIFEMFLHIPNTSTQKIENLLKNLNGTLKTKREMIKSFISAVKGKHVTEMVEIIKVGKIGYNFATKNSTEEIDCSNVFGDLK
ncbi:LOW QUALITY PROTEIN: hypothetical protein EDEG_05096 [Edhazardia aedis USNM 41457]|uniref:Uncharacterized protein n=1 Tax=Edhazardia aedis (strain USNM 41457) TaxID=1003232 RepID=A0A0L1P6G4_EDHAE|nr:LOW QUALITY PROTEIN: hypothetical protein EDEG_05096 [Edhazardia aedis USNM 41457]|eukprot:KNH48521.1 LOW QUALITY PROTEIN: hypothetical protein EDEG_05096 [Edhazardia aedis USNM 41457]